MTFNQLRVFQAVSTHSSMTRASEALGISEPSVFQQIKSLEDWFGAKLYRKVGRAIELTREGRAIQSDIKEVLLKLEQLGGRFKPLKSGATVAPLIIGGAHCPSASFLPTAITAFKKEHPLTQVILRTKSSRAVERLVLNSEVEVGLVTNPSNSPALHTIRYRPEKSVSFIAAKHPLAKKNTLTMAEVARCPLIIRRGESGKGANYVAQIASKGLKPNILMECERAETIKQAVTKGLGLGFLYRAHLASELKRGELKIVKIIGLRTVDAYSYIVHRKDAILSSHAQDFLDLLLRIRERKTSAQRLMVDRSFKQPNHQRLHSLDQEQPNWRS
jgi:DNA-binding transcriptional LysR family regulator